MDGIIILDKSSNVFSRTAGWHVAKMFGEKKFGHIGTLDPMATGVLPIAIGNATKMIPFVEENTPNKKEYLFGLRFGVDTDSLDITGKTLQTSYKTPNDDDIRNACTKIRDFETQIPPMFSAVHINGKRAYELARKGQTIELKPRPIKIYELEYIGKNGDEYNFRIICSRGTYVRSVVRDIAKICDSLATTTYICRTFSNGFDIKNAIKLDFLEKLYNNNERIDKYLMQPDCALGDIPVINLNNEDTVLYKNGGFVKTGETDGMCRVYCGKTFIGMGNVENGRLKPKRTI